MIGFQEIRCHVIFDVPMDFTHKARFNAGGHTTDTPLSITYSRKVSCDIVCLAFLIASLIDLDVLTGDGKIAFFNATCREKIWLEGGVETGEVCGKVVLITTRALYGLKSSGADWQVYLAATLRNMKFHSWMVPLGHLEGWLIQLGNVEGHKRCLPNTDYKECSGK
jgi:hypothetical protein